MNTLPTLYSDVIGILAEIEQQLQGSPEQLVNLDRNERGRRDATAGMLFLPALSTCIRERLITTDWWQQMYISTVGEIQQIAASLGQNPNDWSIESMPTSIEDDSRFSSPEAHALGMLAVRMQATRIREYLQHALSKVKTN